jgi:hypothetical protein
MDACPAHHAMPHKPEDQGESAAPCFDEDKERFRFASRLLLDELGILMGVPSPGRATSRLTRGVVSHVGRRSNPWLTGNNAALPSEP